MKAYEEKSKFHNETLWGQSVDPIHLKMQQNIHLNTLAPLVEVKESGDKTILSYDISSLTTIQELLESQRLNQRLIHHLLENTLKLQLLLDEYMLSIDMLRFHENALYYSASTDQFIWILLPVDRPKAQAEREQLVFFRHIFIELGLIRSSEVTSLLTTSSFSLTTLCQLFIKEASQRLDTVDEPKQGSSFLKWLPDPIMALMDQLKPARGDLKSKSPLVAVDLKPINSLKKTSYVQRHPILLARDQPTLNYKIYYDTCMIGRDDKCELSIDETSISREHAKLYTYNNKFLIEDLNSTNGTFVNNQRVQGKVNLNHGDVLRIGHCDFIFLT